MSADNWAVCPRCLERAQLLVKQQEEKVMATYGKVPVGEFDASRAAIRRPYATQFKTFREDWSVSGAEEGVVTVEYSGCCQNCGLGLEFTHKHEIDTT